MWRNCPQARAQNHQANVVVGGAECNEAMYRIGLNIPDLDAQSGGQPHQANATFDGDIHSFFSHPSRPWLATLFTKRVHRGIKLSRIIILLDSACTVHIVTESWLLDDLITIPPKKSSGEIHIT